MAIRVLVISKLHHGYHRAGQAIVPGESELVVSDEQCAALEGDPRLSVFRLAVEESESAPDTPAAAGDLDKATLGELSPAPESPASEVVEPATKPDSGKGKGK